MSTRLLRCLLVLGALSASVLSATAQIGNFLKKVGDDVKNVGGDLKKAAGPSPEIASFKTALDGASGNVITARKAFLEAQSLLIQAVEPKHAAALKLSEAQRAIEGASSDPKKQMQALKDSQKVSEEANKVLTEKLAASQKLSDESRDLYIKGAVKYVEAVVLEKQQIKVVRALADRGKNLAATANVKDKAHLATMTAPALELATMVPGDVKIGLETLPKLFSFAQSAGIEVPVTEKQKEIIGTLD